MSNTGPYFFKTGNKASFGENMIDNPDVEF